MILSDVNAGYRQNASGGYRGRQASKARDHAG